MHEKSHCPTGIRTAAEVFLTMLLLTGAVCFYPSVAEELLAAGKRCVFVLIPSLYLFSVLAAFGVQADIFSVLAVPFRKCCRKFLKTDAVFLMILLFSQIGGYPIGSQILHQFYLAGRITRQQEERLLCVCMGSGFGFILGAAGGNLRTAMGMWLAISLPNLLAGMWIIRNYEDAGAAQDAGQAESVPVLQKFTESVECGARAMLKITAMVLACSGLLGMVKAVLPALPPVVESLLEVSYVTEYLRQGGSLAGCAAFLSFGGLCVHLQISAVTEQHLPLKKFWLCRGLLAGVTYLLYNSGVYLNRYVLFRCFLSAGTPEGVAVFSDVAACHVSVQEAKHSAAASCCLLVMSVFLLKKHYFFSQIIDKQEKIR